MNSAKPKRWLAASVLLAVAVLQPSREIGAQAKGAPSPLAERMTLTVWLMPNGWDASSHSFENLVQPFVQANPRIKIEVVIVAWGEALARIEAAIAGRIPAPDIVQLGTTWIAAIGAAGNLLDLRGKYDEKQFLPQVLGTTEIADEPELAGKRFAMPWIVDTRALYYNKDYCKRAGVNPDTDFATWETFHQALRKLKKLSKREKPFAPLAVTLIDWNVIHSLSWWIWGAGGDFVRTSKTPGIASPGSLEGIEYAVGLAREGLLSAAGEKRDQASMSEMLSAGEIAATISLPLGLVAEDKFGIAPIPAGPKGRFTFLGGSGLAVLSSTKHPQEATTLLRFLSSEDVQMRFSLVTGGLLAAAGQFDDLLLQLDPFRQAFVAQMKDGRAYPSIAVWGEVEVVLCEGLHALWSKATGPHPYDRGATRRQLQAMQDKIDAIVERRKRPAAPPQPSP